LPDLEEITQTVRSSLKDPVGDGRLKEFENGK
jgi:hypothetical protein